MNEKTKQSAFEVTTRLENLSNDIFCAIFDYLDGYDILKAFADLNHRLQTLINHPSIPINLEYHCRKSIPIIDYYEQMIEPNRARVRSLHLVGHEKNRHDFDRIIFNASFSRLESLTMYYIAVDQLLMSCFFLNNLPRLYCLNLHLNIRQEKYATAMNQIFSLILSLPVLKRCTIFNGLDWRDMIPNVILPNVINTKPSSIEYFKISNDTSPVTLVSLLQHLPNIRHLECGFMAEFDQTTGTLMNVNLPYLKRISIQSHLIGFDQVEVLMRSVGHHVEIFESWHSQANIYLDGQRWQNLIVNYLPCLKVFDMACTNIEFQPNESIHALISPFFSSFWTEHQWYPNLSFGRFFTTLHVHPCKKQWFDRHREIEIDWIISQSPSHRNHVLSHMHKNTSHFNEVEFTYSFETKYNARLIENIKDFLSKVAFTQVSVRRQERLSFIFEMIGDSMIHLDSIVLGCITDTDLQCLFTETTESDLSFGWKDRIKKVKIETIRKIEEIQLITNWFPRMQYLELCIKPNTLDVITALEFIITNRSMKVPNLRSVCFEGINIDRNVLHQLRQVIDAEEFLRDHHIRCVKNQIFIQWNQYDWQQ